MKKKKWVCNLAVIVFILMIGMPCFAATISGTVTYDGNVPRFREIKMGADPICAARHTESVIPQTLVLGENKTMGNVFVRVISGLPNKTFSAPTEPAVLDQKGCMYEPHVLAVMVGQPIRILNPDGTLHNVHALSKTNPEFNIAMPKFRKEIIKTFDKEEFMFPVKCDVHPWMGAWISVMTHPYFSVTKTDGKFTLANLPPGNYKLEAWHERLGTKEIDITISSEDVSDVNFMFKRTRPRK